MGETISGHTLKHVLAAFGAYCIYLLLKNRKLKTAQTKTTSAGSGSSTEYSV
jgi:hypothetical protein